MWGSLGELFRKAKQLGLTTSFDMQWDPQETWKLDIPDVLPYVDVFLPNENELMLLMAPYSYDYDKAQGQTEKDFGMLFCKICAWCICSPSEQVLHLQEKWYSSTSSN